MNQIFLWHKSCFSASQAGFPPCTENRLCGRYLTKVANCEIASSETGKSGKNVHLLERNPSSGI